MKYLRGVVPFVALASAFVIPDAATMEQVSLDSDTRRVPGADSLRGAKDKLTDVYEASHDAFDDIVHAITESFDTAVHGLDDWEEAVATGGGDHPPPPHPPHPPHKPHDPHHKDLTLYQLISQSKYTTKFAKLVDEFDGVVKLLNSTSSNFTIFVPSDKAFEKIPDHGKKPPKEILEKVLLYHIVPSSLPAGKVFHAHTLPTLLEGDELSDEPSHTPQRLAVKLGWTGLYIDNYSRVVYPDIFGTNGVIHGVDNILVPPPSIGDIIKFSPTAFSTFQLAVLKSGFLDDGPFAHKGATVFVPPNGAWKKLGFRTNAFLFSKYGKKYLKAIVQYHIVANQTLYSDDFYGAQDVAEMSNSGVYHVDLPTLLEDKLLGVDIAEWGRLIEIKVNAFTRVAYQDVVAKDGVIQVVSNVLIPPKAPGGGREEAEYRGGEISVDELKERLAPYVDAEEDADGDAYGDIFDEIYDENDEPVLGMEL